MLLNLDRDALLCDLAETYHIYDMRALPLLTLAALSVGLRPDSRIMMKLNGYRYVSPTRMLTLMVDDLQVLRAALTSEDRVYITGGFYDAYSSQSVMAREEKEKDEKYVTVRNGIVEDARRRAGEVNNAS